MRLNKRQKSGIAIFGIIAAVLVLTTLIIPFKKPGASWTMFAFSLISIASGAYICLLAFKNTKDLMSKFYGFPVFRIGVLYVVIQLALTVVIYIIGAFVDVPFWVGFLLSVLMGGAAAIGCITTDNARDIIEEIDNKTYEETKTVMFFQTDIADVLDLCKSEKARPVLAKLVNKFKYSDPVSSPETEESEVVIKNAIDDLRNSIRTLGDDDLLQKIENIDNLLSSRNRICEKSKK